jgi:hypothetical protein
MKQLILAPALVLAMSVAAVSPAYAQNGPSDMTFGSNPFAILVGMLLPAVQKVR